MACVWELKHISASIVSYDQHYTWQLKYVDFCPLYCSIMTMHLLITFDQDSQIAKKEKDKKETEKNK